MRPGIRGEFLVSYADGGTYVYRSDNHLGRER
jgi:hypothetical protein